MATPRTAAARPPTFAAARPGPALPPEHVEPGRSAEGVQPGDFLLVASSSFRGRLIRWGQERRIRGEDRRYVKWTHAALIVDRDGGLIEAVGRGVREYSLAQYENDEYLVVRIVAEPADRAQMVDFARSALRKPYSRLAMVSIALSLLTGSRIAFFVDGQFFCSGLVARALERTGRVFDRDPAHIAPADLAKYYRAGEPSAPTGSALLSTARTSSARDRMPSLR
jgi:cell wall-associated NlpC family hydrolase